MPPFIQIRNVTKSFGQVLAVDNITLDIQQNELFCLLGGSGCGKTTLLRMLAGFEMPTTGQILIDGHDMQNLPPQARPTNMMFQSYALFPHMSVAKNVGYGLKRAGTPAPEIREKVAEILNLVQLGGYETRKPHQLSGGQQQRVALARALIKRPKLLLLDEPLGALDKKLREETQFELINIQESLGITFVVVTHDQEEAMTLSTRLGVMQNGRLSQVGTPHEIYEYPQSRYVADFIGSINLFEGRVKKSAPDHLRITSEDTAVDIHLSHGAGFRTDQEVCFALRPEKVEIARKKPPQSFNYAKGVVEDIAYLGGRSVYLVRTKSGKLLRVTRANRQQTSTPITWEDSVYLHWSDKAGVVLSG